MEKIAIYGKGGIGKSVVATNLSAYYALTGKRVLHIGCDPKTDSSLRLIDSNVPIKTVLEVIGDNPTAASSEEIINVGRLGVECCESGGPPPGQGCGGRGVARTIEFLEEMEILSIGKYDVVIFDVLGDVVCGGFAAPLRAGFAQKVLIVTSEEPMSLFATNNISKAIGTYSHNGVVLGGLIANLKSNSVSPDFLKRFAKTLNTRILAFISRDNFILEAERYRKTIIEYAPKSRSSKIFEKLAKSVLNINPESIELPTPMSENEFFEYIKM